MCWHSQIQNLKHIQDLVTRGEIFDVEENTSALSWLPFIPNMAAKVVKIGAGCHLLEIGAMGGKSSLQNQLL